MDSLDEPTPKMEQNANQAKFSPSFKLPPGMRTVVWQGKFLPAFWSIGASLSVLLNIILLVAVILLGKELFSIKRILMNDVIGGLYYNFLLMDQATIQTDVQVDDSIPVQFALPLTQNTVVVLTQDTLIEDATVSLSTGGLNIVRAPTDILLPKGTRLPVALDLSVPVDTQIPITLTVPVEIPLNETELHEPFVGLQDVVSPWFWMLANQPNSWPQARCAYFGLDCP